MVIGERDRCFGGCCFSLGVFGGDSTQAAHQQLPACTAFTLEFGALWPEHLWCLERGDLDACPAAPHSVKPSQRTTAHLQALEPPQHTHRASGSSSVHAAWG